MMIHTLSSPRLHLAHKMHMAGFLRKIPPFLVRHTRLRCIDRTQSRTSVTSWKPPTRTTDWNKYLPMPHDTTVLATVLAGGAVVMALRSLNEHHINHYTSEGTLQLGDSQLKQNLELIQRIANESLEGDAGRDWKVARAFVGTWVLDRKTSESPGPQLKALGVSWFWVQAAKLATPRVTVKVDPQRRMWHEKIDAGKVFSMKEHMFLDGRAMLKSKQGFQLSERSFVCENGDCVVTKIEYLARDAQTEIRRYIERNDVGDAKAYVVKNTLTLSNGETICRVSRFRPA
mmetsp:Transcript_59595/g.81426  ORF Transcript_59595/g.81426 Transcript_59595/m.81426 type:complete len:287 (-) Transcript_59595:468-1328(-)